MKKLALGLLVGSVLLVGVLLAVAGMVLGTESGTTWLVGTVQSLAPDMVRVGRTQGHFFDHLELDAIELNLASADIDVEKVVLDWSPRQLFRGEFLLNVLSADGVRFAAKPVPEQATEPLQWPIELPAVSAPIRVTLGLVSLTDVQLVSAPEAAPLQLDSATLKAHWADQGIILEQLDAHGPTFSLAIEGQLDPMSDYALRLGNRISLSPGSAAGSDPEARPQPGFDIEGGIEGHLQGDRDRLVLSERIRGGAEVDISAELRRPLVSPQWAGQVRLLSVAEAVLGEQLPMVLSGVVDAGGDLSSAAVVAELSTASEQADLDQLQVQLDVTVDGERKSLLIERLELTQQQQPLSLSLQGEVTEEAVAIDGQWRALQWPLVSQPLVRSEQGTLTLQGPLDGYRFELSAELAGDSIPPGQWRVSGQGDRRHFTLDGLNGSVLDGELHVTGDIEWAPHVAWELNLAAAGIRPGEVLADPHAVVSLDAMTTGSIVDEQAAARVILERLGGTLNGQPLTGRGILEYQPGRIVVDKLGIQHADATLKADGILGAQSNLAWDLDVPRLDRLLADSGGSVVSAGRLTGPQQKPRIEADIDIDLLSVGGVEVEQLDGSIDVDLLDRLASKVSVVAGSITTGGQVIEQFKLVLDGYIRDHTLSVRVVQDQVGVAFAAEGGYVAERWDGSMEQLDINSDVAGNWRLVAPVAVVAGPDQARAEELCLQRDRARLCADGAWRAEGSSVAHFDLEAFPLAWLQPFLSDQIRGMNGILTASGDVEQGRTLQAALEAQVTPGALVLQGANADIEVPHRGLELRAQTKGQGAVGSLRTGVGSSVIDVSFNMPDILSVTDTSQARIGGTLQLDAPDLDLLPLLAPSITAADGMIAARFNVGGVIGQPALAGNGRLAVSHFDMAELGLALSDSRIDINAADDRLTIDGELSSGGRITLGGKLKLDAQNNWPFSMDIKGQDFVAMNLPNLQVSISPDLAIRRSADAMNLTGTLTIPAAEILVRDLPSGSRSASGDVVVVPKYSAEVDAVEEETTPITTDITVVMGNKVHVAALGLDGYVRGAIALRASPGAPLRGTGDVRIDEGTFRAYSQQFDIERGLFSYANSPIDDPGINVRAVRAIDDVTVGVTVLGTARETTITTFSSPAMSENDRISYLVTGKPAREGARLSLDRQISKKLSVGMALDTHTGESAFVSRYRLSRTLHTEVSSGVTGSTLDMFYTIERK